MTRASFGKGAMRRRMSSGTPGDATSGIDQIATSLCDHLGSSEAVQRIIGRVIRLASTRHNVLVTGEAGTYKELVVRALHQAMADSDTAFVLIDCALCRDPRDLESALQDCGLMASVTQPPDTLLHGTLFLDNVDRLPLRDQDLAISTLTRQDLSDPELDIRILSAASHDLNHAVKIGVFRLELKQLLAQRTVKVPPLRDRPNDILTVAERFRELANLELKKSVHTFSHEAEEALLEHSWPGNYSELWSVIYRATVAAKGDIRPNQIRRLLQNYLAKSPQAAETLLRNIMRAQTQSFIEDVRSSHTTNASGARSLAGRIMGRHWTQAAKANSRQHHTH
jgi:two-component system, NtrC family, response regulator HydG